VDVQFLLLLECDEKTMIDRVLARSKIENREDDNIQTIQRRIQTYRNETLPVVDFYAKLNKVRKVSLTRFESLLKTQKLHKLVIIIQNYIPSN